jgi:predicted transglutaminase-like cysteine proteinase
MFGRVAAWGFAALLVMSPATPGVETSSSADADARAAAVLVTADQPQDQAEDKFQSYEENPTEAPAQPAALDRPAPAIPSPPLAEPFGLAAVPVAGGDILAKWSAIEVDIRAEKEVFAGCRDNAQTCPAAARNFLAIVAQGRAQTGRARISVINRAINLAIEPMSDFAQWGVPDRWSAPLETLTTGRGDCEDYAIAKYVALTEAGVAAADVKLVIVRNTAAGEDHAVAAVRLDRNWLMLDNRWLALVEDSEVSRAIPLLVLDGDGVRQFMPTAMAGARRASTPASLGF